MTIAQAISPTAAQKEWLNKNRGYQRISHAVSTKFTNRGTLRACGTFIAEGPGAPVMDGNGDFGVGIPVADQSRRR
jgi:hypothetical protein